MAAISGLILNNEWAKLMKSPKGETDVIVVGSGPGGATVARDLTKSGKKVVILERGDNKPVKGTFKQFANGCFVPGRSLLITQQALGMVRGLTTGGSSIYYCGCEFKPLVTMLKSYNIDIAQEVSEIYDELPTAPLSDELMPPAGQMFLKSARELGYDCHKMNKFIYQEKCRASCELCSYGCPYDAKWNARFFVNEALKDGAEMVNGAKVDKVIIENGKAIGVEYKHVRKVHRLFAEKTVIAAGGIGSPLILRKSGIQGVGYDFFFDPIWFILGKVKALNEGRGIPMSAVVHLEKDGIVITDFNMPHLIKTLFDLEVFQLKKVFSYQNILPIMVKVRDDLGGKITKRGFLSKKLTDNDWEKLKKGAQISKRILENLGATEIYKTWLLAAHPGGTVKIGDHLDENLQTKYRDLYVCDASVFPEKLGVPPTSTILALGKRLARHLVEVSRGA
ncbi:MAG: GMC family oxidoreductase [Thermodesulfobacteriota bacterium]